MIRSIGVQDIHKFFYISQKKLRDSVIPKLWEISQIFSSTFIYQPILMRNSLNVNIIDTQNYHKPLSEVVEGHPFI